MLTSQSAPDIGGGQLRRRAVHGVAWSGVEGLSGQVISFLVFIVLARFLSSSDFGVVAVANLYVLVAQFFVFQGLGQAIIQFEDLDDEHLDTVFWINMGVGCLILLITNIIAGPAATWFGMRALAGILRALSPIFFLAALTDVQNNLLTRQLEFRSLALRTLTSYLAGGVVGIWLAWRGAGAWSLVGQQLTIWMINLAALWTASSWRPRLTFSPPRAGRLLRFGVKLLWVDLASLLNRRADQLFVGKFLGASILGFYAVGARVSTLLSEVLTRTLARVSVSTLARLQNQTERFAAAVYQMIELQSAFVAPAAVGLMLVSPEVVLLFFGPKWSGSVPIMQILLLACPFEAMSAMHQSILVALGRPAWCSIITTIHAVANIVLFIVAIRWGGAAVALAFSGRAVLMYPVELAFLRRVTPISGSRIIRSLEPQVLSVLIMAVAVLLVQARIPAHATALRLAITVALGAATYGASLALINPRLLSVLWGLRSLPAKASLSRE